MRNKLLTILFLQLSVAAFSEEQGTKNHFYFNAENVFETSMGRESASAEIGYQGFENEISLSGGIAHHYSNKLTISGQIDSYSDILNQTEGSFLFAEQELTASAIFSWLTTDELTVDFSAGIFFNIRPEELFRVGPGIGLSLAGEYDASNIYFELNNCFNNLFGSPADGSTNYLLADVFSYSILFDVFNFIKSDINLGFYAEGEIDSEIIFSTANTQSTVIETEFFTGLHYAPVDLFCCNLGMALYHTYEEGETTLDIGMKTGLGFSGDHICFDLNYIPHLYCKNNETQTPSAHALEAVISVNLN